MTRLHPLSAVVDALQRAFQFGSFAVFAAIVLSGPLGLLNQSALFVLAPLGALVGAGYGVARYLRFTYELGPEHLVVASGVFSRQEREIPLRRVQNVDVSRSLVQRALGLATVRFETAGGSATEAELDAVSAETADRLRHEVGERVRAVREAERGREAAGEEGSTGADEPAGTAEDVGRPRPPRPSGAPGTRESSEESRAETLYEISSGDLLVLSAISFRPGAIAAPVFGAPFVGDAVSEGGLLLFRFFGGGRPGGAPDLLALGFTAVAGLAAFAVTVWVASAALTFARYYDFHLERVADELRYERGLLGRYSGTVPLEKVQTVSIGENVAMRRLGYATLSVETAGYAPGSSRAGGAETTIPLAARRRVVAIARDVQPFAEPAFERPPSRARRRYAVRYALLSLVLAGVALGVSRVWTPLPALAAVVPLVGLPLAPVAARAKWRNRGHDELDRAVLTRSGFWHRSTRVVPYYRLQTVFVTRTVFQRRWGLASVTADTASTATLVGGDATAYDLDDDDARSLHDTLRFRLGEQLRSKGRSPAPRDPTDADLDGSRSSNLPSEGGVSDESIGRDEGSDGS